MKRRLGAIEPVEVANEGLQALVRRVVEQPPGQRLGEVPFVRLAEFLAHEKELLAGMRPHEGVIGAGGRELLPFVAGNLADDRPFAVHHFVMRNRQDEILGEGVEQAEGQLVVAPAPVHRVARDIFERVVHPAHVPLGVEAEAAGARRHRDACPCGRFLGDHERAGKSAADELVGVPDEGDRVAIVVAPIRVGRPFAGLPRIVEIEHRGDGVDAQAVDVEAVDPVERARIEKIGDFAPAEIVDRGVPVGMKTAARVGMLIERRAVEMREAMRVDREMRRHPIEDHAEPGGMRTVDEARKTFRLAEPARRREQADRLVAPGSVERVLGDGQQLEMGEAHVDGIGDQRIGELIVVEKRAVLRAPP